MVLRKRELSEAPPEGGGSRPLRIGIVGAGLVGETAAIALSKLPDVEVVAFERSPAPRETGAWISMTVSGLTVLDKLIDLEEIQRILYRGDHNAAYFTRHWRTGEIIATSLSSPQISEKFRQARTHRVPLLNVLLSNVPKGTIKYGRSVVGHEVTESHVRLDFEGGESEVFDLVIAADGLYSKFRRTYVPEAVSFKGTVSYRTIFHKSQVAHIKNLPHDSSAWRSNGEVVFLSELGLDQYGTTIMVRETPEYASKLQWARSTGKEGVERLIRHFADWDPLINEVLETLDDIDAYPLDSAPWMKNLVRHDRIAFVGDAAHPTAGAYGAGATMGQGDVWALFLSLQVTSTYRSRHGSSVTYDLPRALKIYNETRRHFLGRVEQQMSLDRIDGEYISAAGDDEEEWIRRFQECFKNQTWLTEHDVEAEFIRTSSAESIWSASEDGSKKAKVDDS